MAVIFCCYGSTEQGLSAYAADPPDPFWAKMDLYCCVCGEIITGNFIYQLVFWCLRWETGIDTLLHHLGFMVAGILVLWVQLYPRLSAAAIGMEVSSPFLSLHMLVRQFEGSAPALMSSLAAAAFAAVFFVVRIFFYGYVIMDFQYQYFAHWDRFPSWADPMLTLAILSVFSLGWVLQLFWARMVWSKSIKTLKTLMGMKKSTQGQHIACSLLSQPDFPEGVYTQ
mmetsp:Transcript_8938/g.13507  ORF Transcript_8938/g.13507 Transcript_8938/m.13507 type:complete len:225 (-) Transcript_8938:46-720(-)